MESITFRVPDEVAQWIREQAAGQDKSVSKMLADLLNERMNDEDACEAAKRVYLARKPRVISSGPYPTREEVHDRDVVRRHQRPGL